jgi:uncharacterized tellurite resistance protein B-like protein
VARRRRNSGSGGVIGFAALLFLGLLASIPKEIWIVIGAVAVIGAIIYFANRSSSETPQKVTEASAKMLPPKTGERGGQISVPARLQRSTTSQQISVEPQPVTLIAPQVTAEITGFKLPRSEPSRGTAQWIPPGHALAATGSTLRDIVTIPGGMIYYGSSLVSPYGTDPCLIDPTKTVAATGNYSERQFGYWPSYAEITPSARRAYLNWLAGGRRATDADIGYVFLFLYGLERRVFVDGRADPAAIEDWPAIATELRGLVSVYGERSGSFQRYAGALLDYVEIGSKRIRLYKQPVPEFTRGFELPSYIRLALGQAAADGEPLPAEVALAWLRLSPDTYLRTPATRCAEEFDRLFVKRYQQAYGTGIKLPRNKTKLKLVYTPASAALRGSKDLMMATGDLPDVSILTGPIEKLRSIGQAVTDELDSYSRLLGRSPEARSTLEATLMLPPALWAESMQAAIRTLVDLMVEGRLDITFKDLLTTLGASGAPSKDFVISLASALEVGNIAMEPDVLAGAKIPKSDQIIVLFMVPPGDPPARDTRGYEVAALTLQLSAVVASADGKFCEVEETHLRQQVERWSHLLPSQRHRLLAHLHWLTFTSINSATLKQKVAPLGVEARDAIGAFMVKVALADGMVLPAEVKALEKIYKLLGIDSTKVFSAVHGAASGMGAVSPAKSDTARFKLDQARVAELQRDTEKVSALLSNIFVEDESSPVISPVSTIDREEESAVKAGLWGLDEVHSTFARTLLGRPQWTRRELIDLATDLDLMVDGALERINDAAFEAVDMAITEGEDPIDINIDIVEKLAA